MNFGRNILMTGLACYNCLTFAFAAPLYTVETMGLFDTEHSRDDGYQLSAGTLINDAGQVAGVSERYEGGGIIHGYSAWLFDGMNTRQMGLTDPVHTKNDGYRENRPSHLNSTGLVVGSSARYLGSNSQLGKSIWVYNGTDTIRIGLDGEEHTRVDGYQYHFVDRVTDSGSVSGYTTRYNNSSTEMGRSVWRYDGKSTVNTGLTGSGYVRDDGYQFSSIYRSNDSGQILGYSYRYNNPGGSSGQNVWIHRNGNTSIIGLSGIEYTGPTGYHYSSASGLLNRPGQAAGITYRYVAESGIFLGSMAWFFDGTDSIQIGLTDSEHTSSTGYRSMSVTGLSETGYVIGISRRFTGEYNTIPESAWIYDGSDTIRIGLTDAEHTRNDGFQYNYPSRLNDAGHVTGFAYRYDSNGNDLGTSAWLYNGSETVKTGLTDNEHTREDGYQYVFGSLISGSGYVAGISKRFDGSADHGYSVWLYRDGASINTGLADAMHTRADGYRNSSPGYLSESGHMTGYSDRFNGGSGELGQNAWYFDGKQTHIIDIAGPVHTRDDGYQYSLMTGVSDNFITGYSTRFSDTGEEAGQTAWVYDVSTGTTHYNDFSVSPTSGYAYSDIAQDIGDNGLLVGHYVQYDETDGSYLGQRAFGFTVEDGFFAIDSLIAGGLKIYGLEHIEEALGDRLAMLAGTASVPGTYSAGIQSRTGYIARPVLAHTGANTLFSCPEGTAVDELRDVRTCIAENNRDGRRIYLDEITSRELDFVVKTTNTGDTPADGVYIETVLDLDIDASTLSIFDGGTYDAETRTIRWNIGHLEPCKIQASRDEGISCPVSTAGTRHSAVTRYSASTTAEMACGASITNQASITYPGFDRQPLLTNATNNYTQPAEDIDADCDIDIDDVIAVRAYLQQPVENCTQCDLNRDGRINSLDVRIVAQACDLQNCKRP